MIRPNDKHSNNPPDKPPNNPADRQTSQQADLLAGYVLGDLTPEEAARLQQALANAPTLRRELKSFEEAFALLPYGLLTLKPSPHLKDSIISAAHHLANHPAATDTSLEPPPSKRCVNSLSRPNAQQKVASQQDDDATQEIAPNCKTSVQQQN
jgi:hypothetical protein